MDALFRRSQRDTMKSPAASSPPPRVARASSRPNFPENASGTLTVRRDRSANLLYKLTLVLAASRRANIICNLDVVNSWRVLRTCAGPGEKTGRSPSQTGHGAPERCAKQEIQRRRFSVNQQTRKRRNVFLSS